jgi:23S rRNA (cytosine1962-C5)-methyltransferase
MAGLIIRPRSRIFHGHDWVYATEVLKSFGDPKDGEVVSLKDGADRLIGSAIYNSRSQIVARRISRQRQALDADFFKRRIAQAIEYRVRREVDMRLCRVVWSESDGLPGLIVDRYGDHLVLQTLTLAFDQRTSLIVEALRDLLPCSSIVARNDAPIRKAEGLPLEVQVVHGDAPAPFLLPVDRVTFEFDLLHGQKTGFYLDQRANYRDVASHASGRRVLDCFANQGAFAFACARAGASEVTAIEISEESVAAMKRNAERNALPIHTVQANVFDALKELELRKALFDLIILDPPSFTKSKGTVSDARRGYKEIHLRALRLLDRGGQLATFCCSHHISHALFKEIIVEAGVDARKTLRQLAAYTQSADHPIIASLPETEYLKGFLFELAPGR